jgi:hypothetical protein
VNSGNVIEGNDIGLDSTGLHFLPNGNDGIYLDGGMNETIGGTATGAGNSIEGNGHNGVTLENIKTITGIAILGNSIDQNGNLGIDLGNNGVTQNAPGGLHSGPNNLQNYPVLTLGEDLSIHGSLNSTANTAFRIEVFASTLTTPPGQPQGLTLLGVLNETTDAGGNVSFTAPFAAPAGEIITATATDPNNDTSEFSAAATTALALGGNWIPLGPVPISDGQTAGGLAVSGRITGVATDPQDANTIFVTAAGGGVWRTTDGGASWTALTDYLTVNGTPVPLFMGALAETRDANDNEIVYAGTGEANNALDNYYGEGILVSTNGGSTWTLQNDGGVFTGASVSKIVIDPADTSGKTVYVTIDNNAQHRPQNMNLATGIYKSTDGGATWTNTTAAAGLTSTDTWSDLVIDPVNHKLFAAVGSSDGSASNGVYTSPDGGNTWSMVAALPSGTAEGRIALALFDNGAANEMFVSIAQPSGATDPEDATSITGKLKAVLRSTDGERTFSDISSSVIDYMNGQGWYATTLAIDPANANYVYAASTQATQDNADGFTGSPIESFDGGQTWHDVATDPGGVNGPHSDAHAVAFDAAGDVIDGNDGVQAERRHRPVPAALDQPQQQPADHAVHRHRRRSDQPQRRVRRQSGQRRREIQRSTGLAEVDRPPRGWRRRADARRPLQPRPHLLDLRQRLAQCVQRRRQHLQGRLRAHHLPQRPHGQSHRQFLRTLCAQFGRGALLRHGYSQLLHQSGHLLERHRHAERRRLQPPGWCPRRP